MNAEEKLSFAIMLYFRSLKKCVFFFFLFFFFGKKKLLNIQAIFTPSTSRVGGRLL